VLAVAGLVVLAAIGMGLYLVAGTACIAGTLAVALPVASRYGYAAGMAVLGSVLAVLAGSAVVLCVLA
jgi:uncharacterized membrane protein